MVKLKMIGDFESPELTLALNGFPEDKMEVELEAPLIGVVSYIELFI